MKRTFRFHSYTVAIVACQQTICIIYPLISSCLFSHYNVDINYCQLHDEMYMTAKVRKNIFYIYKLNAHNFFSTKQGR